MHLAARPFNAAIAVVFLTACSTCGTAGAGAAAVRCRRHRQRNAPITLADVDERAMQATAGNFGSMTLSQALYEARRTALDEIVAERLIDEEAKARGIDRETLIGAGNGVQNGGADGSGRRRVVPGEPGRVQGAPLEQVRSRSEPSSSGSARRLHGSSMSTRCGPRPRCALRSIRRG